MDNLDAATIDLAQQLIAKSSVSPEDGGCQALMASYLESIGFNVTHLPFGDVSNFWATHGEGEPRLALAGHTDVVPTGPMDEWITPPFEPTLKGNMLHGRGAADMKGSLAAMLTAARRFVEQHPDHAGTLAFLVTSDEEADATHGTVKVIDWLKDKGQVPTWTVIGEPSSAKTLGDVVRIGRRGSLSARLKVRGIQGHIAYPADADNPIHRAIPALAELTAEVWDEGNARFPPTSMQISNIHAGTGANNVIPGSLELLFNFRFSTESTDKTLRSRTEAILTRHQLDYEINWSLSGQPFLTTGTALIDAVQHALGKHLGIAAELSTSGGTSDGRFIAPAGSEVVELGPLNDTIHQLNECIDTRDLVALSKVYSDIARHLLCHDA